MKTTHYKPSDLYAWPGRTDNLSQERIFQVVEKIDARKPLSHIKKPGFAIIGFCSDAGIKRNKGREGARLGPASFRRYFGNFVIPPKIEFTLYDFGDIHCDDDNLEEAQTLCIKLIRQALEYGLMPLIIGGGHELSWPGYLGTSQVKNEVGIINFDAHFDLRPVPLEGANSGTSFTQIAEYCASVRHDFNYLVVGLQNASATQSLMERAKALNTHWIDAHNIHEKGLEQAVAAIENFIAKNRHIYLTICLDVFAQAFAPGVSAPQALGLTPWQVVPLLKRIMLSGKVAALDIAELSPPLDEGDKTSRLCAALLYELIISA